MGLESVVGIAYGVCCGSFEKLQRNVIPRIGDHPLIVMYNQTSIAVAYNAILSAYQNHDLDMLILLHDDLEITDPSGEAKFSAAISQPNVALAGVIGGTDLESLYWWNGETIGHQKTDTADLDFGRREGDALFIEGSIMVFSPWAIENIRFDERYPRFLGYDDICMTVREKGKRTVIADVDTHHHSTLGFKSDAIRRDFELCEKLFREKWSLDASDNL